MNQTPNSSNPSSTRDRWCLVIVGLIGVLLAAGFAWMAFLGERYAYGTPFRERPVVWVTALLFLMSILSLVAVYFAVSIRGRRKSLMRMVVLFAVSYRLMLLFSPPFLEIDLYRYMWDGIVLKNGFSPYRFSPQDALCTERPRDESHAQIVALAGRTESIHTIVSRIHYARYTTIYPPVSQVVFALAMSVTPDQSSVLAHLTVMKMVLTVFDLATFALLIRLLGRVNYHPGWSLVYGWSPLVIKEFANSGHLDSIAVFFTTSAVYALVCSLRGAKENSHSGRPQTARWKVALSAVLLSLAVGAKLFPVILAPLFAAIVLKRFGWRLAAMFCVCTAMTSAMVLYPMAREIVNTARSQPESPASGADQAEAKEGLSSFLSRWQMNDLAFRFVYENVNHRTPSDLDRPWYLVTTEAFRKRCAKWAERAGWPGDYRYLFARLVTVALFLAFYVLLLFRIYRLRGPNGSSFELELAFLKYAFLVVAVFFFLQPTQNPWYWTWALPLVCFHPNRGWLAVGPLLFVYYLRFWIRQLELQFIVGSFTYSNERYFEHCVVWFEYAPVFFLLIGFWVHAKLQSKRCPSENKR